MEAIREAPRLPLSSPPGACPGNSSTSVNWGNHFVVFPHPSDHWALFPDVQRHKKHFFLCSVQVFGCRKWKANSDSYYSILAGAEVSLSAFVSHPCQSLCELGAFTSFCCWSSAVSGMSLPCRSHREKLYSVPKKSHHCATWWTSLPLWILMGLQGERRGCSVCACWWRLSMECAVRKRAE